MFGGFSIPGCSPCPCFVPGRDEGPPVSGRGRGFLPQGEGPGLPSSCLLNLAAKCFHVGSVCCPPQLPSPPQGQGPAQPGWAAPITAWPSGTPGAGVFLVPVGLAWLPGGGTAGSAPRCPCPHHQPGTCHATYPSKITALRRCSHSASEPGGVPLPLAHHFSFLPRRRRRMQHQPGGLQIRLHQHTRQLPVYLSHRLQAALEQEGLHRYVRAGHAVARTSPSQRVPMPHGPSITWGCWD